MSWIKINEATYQFDDGDGRFFLLTGSVYALLVDSGMNVNNAAELARELTSLPLKLFNTHTDWDHTGSNDEFDEIMLNPAELVNYGRPHCSDRIVPVYDGDIIDIGGRPLKAIALPGHTPGSTALLDVGSGMLFSGDPIQDGNIYMFGPMRNMAAYILSLKRLLRSAGLISAVYPCHGSCPVAPSLIEKLIEGAEKTERGEIFPVPFRTADGRSVSAYAAGAATFLLDR